MDLEVIDADGRPVHRGDITFTYDASGQLTAHGLLDGDRLFIDGVLRYYESSILTRLLDRAYHESVPQIYARFD